MVVKELTKDNFAEIVKGKTVVVDFYADWCGPCQMIKPIFAELSEEMDDVVFAKVNTEQEPDLAREFHVMSIPTMVVLKDGEEIDRTIGAMPKDMLRQKIESIK